MIRNSCWAKHSGILKASSGNGVWDTGSFFNELNSVNVFQVFEGDILYIVIECIIITHNILIYDYYMYITYLYIIVTHIYLYIII